MNSKSSLENNAHHVDNIVIKESLNLDKSCIDQKKNNFRNRRVKNDIQQTINNEKVPKKEVELQTSKQNKKEYMDKSKQEKKEKEHIVEEKEFKPLDEDQDISLVSKKEVELQTRKQNKKEYVHKNKQEKKEKEHIVEEKECKPLDEDQDISLVSKKEVELQTRKQNKKEYVHKNKQEKKEKELVAEKIECKPLDEDQDVSLVENKIDKNNKNLIKNVKKSKINSPNHKLTEYFSHLKVDEHAKFNTAKQNLKSEQIEKNEISSEKIISNHSNQSLLDNSSHILKKKSRNKVKSNIESINHKVTEYFHVRRSERKYKKNIIEEKQRELENKIINKIEDGLKIEKFKDKGRGIVTTKEFYKGDYVIEYIGDLIDGTIAKQREMKYAKKQNIGCYMYYFKHKNVQYCIDATEESEYLGRLINHSRKGNLVSRIIEINQTPHLILFAKTDIPIGTELLYDYGDRSKESIRNNPWLSL